MDDKITIDMTNLSEDDRKQLLELIEKSQKTKSPFDRVDNREHYYSIEVNGKVSKSYEYDDYHSNCKFGIANYCTDKKLMQLRALHETLCRQIWRIQQEVEGKQRYGIGDEYCIVVGFGTKLLFKTHEAFEKAENLVINFIRNHPEYEEILA